ncbi:hypothetical protein FKM82_027285, partial [Ascaphus truei]
LSHSLSPLLSLTLALPLAVSHTRSLPCCLSHSLFLAVSHTRSPTCSLSHSHSLLLSLSQASLLEQSLTAELQSLREDSRELSLSRGHFTSCLQSENALLLERKRDLEFQVRQLREESETAQNIVYTLKESVLQLERHNSEIDTKLQQVESEAQELRDSQRRLHSQVRELQEELHMRDSRYSMRDGRESLLSEIQQSACCQEQEVRSSLTVQRSRTLCSALARSAAFFRHTGAHSLNFGLMCVKCP